MQLQAWVDPWEALADHQGALQAWEGRLSWEGHRLLVASQVDRLEDMADHQGHPWADQEGCHHLREDDDVSRQLRDVLL